MKNKHINFQNDFISNYKLLPFKFERLNENEIIVNEVGDYMIVPNGTVNKIVRRQLDPKKNDQLFKDLTSNFFISNETIPPLIDVLATRYRTKKSFLDDFTGLHIFVMTLRCNHSCHYCQVSRVDQYDSNSDMSKANIINGIEKMLMSPNQNLTMEFQGGEPLIVFDNVQFAIEEVKKRIQPTTKKITYVICTNLVLITNTILNYCKENEILISTSLDGPEFIHNSNRKISNANSYKYAINGIQLSREILGNDRVSALLTVSPYSLNYPIEIVDEYFNQGFKDIFLRPISPYGYAAKNISTGKFTVEQFISFFKTALNRIIYYNRKGVVLVENYAQILLKKILTPFAVGYVDLLSPAGLINNVIVFNYDGKVYPSDEARMLAEMGDNSFALGDLEIDSYKYIYHGSKALEIADNWSLESLAGCSECGYQTYCGADPVRYYATQKDMYGFRPSSFHCKKNKEIIKYLIELLECDKEIESIFYKWINL